MTRLVWNQPEQKRYESGVDRGVLYPSLGVGVVWNGLTSVEESYVGGDVTSFYFDGVKTLDIANPKNFQAVITAFSAPEEFSPIVGDLSVLPGFILTRQPRKRFGFSYRTLIGDGLGYKIHIVYNALASTTKRANASINKSVASAERSWQIDATPPKSGSYRPSAHFVVDSTKTNADTLRNLEDILYGTVDEAPRLPDVDELIDLVGYWEPLIIIPQILTGLAELVPGLGDLTKTKTAGINRDIPETRLVESEITGLYRLE